MLLTLGFFVAGAGNAPPILAQTAAAPKFEVASVKRSTDCDTGGGRKGGGAILSPGGLSLACRPLMAFIRMAYVDYADGKERRQGRPLPIEGGPAWINSDLYTIDAKPAGGETQAMMRGPMMQALLEDRFKLKMRRETREVLVYVLTVGKGGPKLQAAKAGSCTAMDFTNGPPPAPGPGQPPPCGFFRFVSNGGIDTSGQTMAGLCMQFSAALDRDVIDRTGIAGGFDIHLDLSQADLFPFASTDNGAAPSDPAAAAVAADPAGAIFAAVKRLGLQLESAKAPGEYFAIDRVERPSEN